MVYPIAPSPLCACSPPEQCCCLETATQHLHLSPEEGIVRVELDLLNLAQETEEREF